MKKILFILLGIFTLNNIYSQNEKQKIIPDDRVIEAFGQETVDHYIQNSPQTLLYYNFFVNNAYTIQKFPEEKMDQYSDYPELKLKEKFSAEKADFSQKGLAHLNILKYDFVIDQLGGAIYRLGDSKMIIIFYSGREITDMFNNSLKNQ